MFKKLFQTKVEADVEKVYSPLSGETIALSEVPDPVFAQKMMGDGIAIIPTKGEIYSPVDGTIVQIFPSKHAIGIQSKKGLELLIHIGLETVALNGEGFDVFVEEGQVVKAGEHLLNFDIDFLESHNKEIVTPIIVTNMLEKVESIEPVISSEVSHGDLIVKCSMK
ncbi:PTS glucose transporter subunit IIA [Paenibacillus sp. 102]|uniref:PTS sugar transporter subunit IIA n=1 Tax=Paenibacillus sp. 102 TaxID=3120823 RepID=UPI0031B9E75E